MTPLKRMMAMKALVDDINMILARHGVARKISLQDITVTDKTVTDLVKQDGKLSQALIDQVWPRVPSEIVYHYTSRASAEAILRSGIFRLTSILKRYNEGEVITVCRTHGLAGYLASDKNGDPVYKSIMSNMYYASFTECDMDSAREEHMWRTFAGSDGVRLKFRIIAKNHNFRRIKYEAIPGIPIPILDDLVRTVKANHGLEFVMKGISRLCAFYLCGQDYGIEKELRILHRVWGNQAPQPFGSGSAAYLEIPLGAMSEVGYQLEVLEVQASTKPAMPDKYHFSMR